MQALLVDDSRSSLMQLRRLVEGVGDLSAHAFDDPRAALDLAGRQRFDIAVVDYVMPRIDGISFIRQFRTVAHNAHVPIVMVTASNDDSIRMAALAAGATDFMTKTPNTIELTIKLRNLLRLSEALHRLNDQTAWLAAEIEKATRSLQAREEEMIFRLSLAVEYRDNDTGDHTLRVATYSRMIAETLGLSAETCRNIFLAAPLHDIGKVAVPDRILLKPGRLDQAEVEIMRAHTETGAKILAESSSDLMRLAAEIADSHHERWDGLGYPRRLKGAAIPLSARIVAVADVFDALTTERPYKVAMSTEAAFDCLYRERGRHFDPDCHDAFVKGFLSTPPMKALGRHPVLMSEVAY